MDTFTLLKFVGSWKQSEHKYVFCCIDVFTRKAYVIPMKDKPAASTIEAY